MLSKVSLYSAGCFLSSQTRCRMLTAAYDVGIRRATIDEADLGDLRAARTWVKTAMLRGGFERNAATASTTINTCSWLQACFQGLIAMALTFRLDKQPDLE